MDETIKTYRDECAALRSTIEENDKKIKELLTNPIVCKFFRLYSDNIKLKEKLNVTEKRLSYLEMSECQHAFVITEFVEQKKYGEPIYHCVKCGLTNYYDIKGTPEQVDIIKLQMGDIFIDTFINGTLLTNELISLEDAKDVYNTIIKNNPNITNTELQKTLPIVLVRMKKFKEQSGPVKKLTPPRNTGNK